MTAAPKSLVESSCFFRLRSPHKLAEFLGVTLAQLQGLVKGGMLNYQQFELDGRFIETPLPTLKRVQRRIHDLLTRVRPPNYLFSAYGGKNFGAVKNAATHTPGTWMIGLDIRKFFPTSDGRKVFDLFRNTFECSPHIAAMLWKLCAVKNPIEGTRRGKPCHLPTGGVTSPILAYFCYQDMFSELADLAATEKLIISVFADDITFSGDNANEAVLAKARVILLRYGLVSHGKKEKVWSPKYGNKLVTGTLVTPKGLRVPYSRKQKIAQLRSALLKVESPNERSRLYQQYYGALSSAGQIEPRFGAAARCVLAAWKKEKLTWNAYVRSSCARRR